MTGVWRNFYNKTRTTRCCQLRGRELNVTFHSHSHCGPDGSSISNITCKLTYSIFVFHNFSLRSRWGHRKETWTWRFQRFALHHGKSTDFITYLSDCYYSICPTIGPRLNGRVMSLTNSKWHNKRTIRRT